jgi:hypothetical protein
MNNPPDVLYTCIPSYGHLDWGGVLDTLMQLKARGHKIIVGSGLNVAPFVLSQGFEFLDLELNALKCKEEGETLSELLKSHRDQNFFSVEESLAAASTLSRYLIKKHH